MMPLSLIRAETKSSVDTNATAPNQPGPGRTVGLMYDFLGEILEKSLNNLATTRGATPDAIVLKIRSLAKSYYSEIPERNSIRYYARLTRHGSELARPLTKEEDEELINLCNKLFKFTR